MYLKQIGPSILKRGLLSIYLTVLLVGYVIAAPNLTPHHALAQENEEPPANAVQPPPITFFPEAKVLHQPFQLSLKSQAGGIIRYTTNGALPTAGSTPYTGTIAINQSTVIRAQPFNSAGLPLGDVETRSYIIAAYAQTIPVISIAINPGDFAVLQTFPQERGIEWERPINMEYFAPGGQSHFNVKAGIRIHGNSSRLYSAKKSFRLYFRKLYGGPGNLEYPLFEDSPVTKFDKLILRGGYNDSFTYVTSTGLPSEQSFTAKYIGDQVVRNLHRGMGQPIAHGNWTLLYINGQFWGLYNLTERIDQQFLRSYSDKDADWDVIVKEVGFENNLWYSRENAREGDLGGWLENQSWVGSADFGNPGNIGVLEWRVDMENLFSYMFLNAYVQNYDWPGNNWVVIRRKDEGNVGPWQMMVWDAEYSFGSGMGGYRNDLNTLVRVHSPHDSITRILEKPFIRHCGLKARFVKRGREYLGLENRDGRPENEVGQLSKERVKAEILKQAALVRPFIQMEAERWTPDLGTGVELFDQNIESSLKFVDVREEVMLRHLDILMYETFTTCQ